MPEVRQRIHEMTERARLLGASDAQIEWLITEWDGFEPEYRDELFHMNDQVLGRFFERGQTDAQEAAAASSATPNIDAALAGYAKTTATQEDEDWGTLGLAIPTILDAVGDDADHAYRLYNLEGQADRPRTSLLAALERIAWPHGKPLNEPDDDEEKTDGDTQ